MATSTRLAEAIGLAIAPAATFFALHVRAMPRTLMIDPFFYGAYALDGPDLLKRFGPGNYYWPRVGFILPDRLFITLFGPLGGFYAFRYLLALAATIPVYILVRQLAGRWAAWLAVLVVLSAPVVLSAWGSDYPDSSTVSYLMAAAACVSIEGRSPRARTAWLVGAGVFFALALNSQIVAIFMVAGIVTGRVVATWARGRRALAGDIARIAAATVATTALLVLVTALTMDGQWDIFRPTAHAILQYRKPAQIALFHSTTWRWLIDDIYVLVPPGLVVAWIVSAWPVVRRPGVPAAEVGLAVALAVGFVLHTAAQFAGQSWTLEYYLYTSMLWAVVLPLLVLTVLRVAGGASARTTGPAVAVAAVGLLAVPLLLRPFRDQLQVGLRLAIVLCVVPAAAALLARVAHRVAALRAGAAVIVATACTLLVVGLPKNPTIYPHQVAYFTPDYGTELFGDGTAELDRYRIFAGLHDVVPTADQVPGDLVTWAPPAHSDIINVASAQYLWLIEALPSAMPQVDPGTLGLLASRRPRLVVMLSDTGHEFDSGEAALGAAGFAPRTLRDATLVAGADVVFVRVVELQAGGATTP